MDAQTQQFDFAEVLAPLRDQLQNSQLRIEDWVQAERMLQNAKLELQELLEFAVQKRQNERDFLNLWSKIAGENASYLIDKLRGIGYGLKQNKDLKEAFDKAGYRLMEQARTGKRAEVHYGILRILYAQRREFPKDLLEAFKPLYSDELFKVFILSFLSGILSPNNEQ